METLRTGGRGRRHKSKLAAGPVRGHLAAAAAGVVCADGLHELCGDGLAEGECEGAVAVIGEEPIVAGTHGHAGSDEERLMPGAGDLEEDLLLLFEEEFSVVHLSRGVHQPVEADELFRRERTEVRAAGLPCR